MTEYQLLVRCLSEQTIVEEASRRLRTKEDGGFHSGMLQNPSDPDATFRAKAGKEHQGYVANLEETVGKNGSVITDYQYEKNNYSDSQFLKDSLERSEVHKEETTLIADGAYSGKENHDLATEKNIRNATAVYGNRRIPQAFQNPQWSRNITLHVEKIVSCRSDASERIDTREILLWL